MSDGTDLTAYLRRLQLSAEEIPLEAAAITAPILAENIRDVMGLAPPLDDLAPSTQAERERKGFTPNDPLVRSGALRDSVVPAVEANIAMAGSSDPISRVQEFGLGHVPPRPAFQIGLERTMLIAVRIARNLVRSKLSKR